MMRGFVPRLSMIILLGTLVASCSEDQSTAVETKAKTQSADTIYTNGKIYTVDKKQPWAEAVAIKDGKFLAVGSKADIEAVTSEGTKVIDLGGKFVMPGIVDLHTHPFITPWYGSMNLSLKNPGDPDKILKEIKEYADANPDKKWILVGQWHVGIFPDDAPKKEWLDAIVPDRPVAVLDQTGHSFWVNSKALELAGITKDTPTDSKVVIVKDPETGEPTGTLRELAMPLIEIVVPQATAEEYAEPIYNIFNMFLSYGVTSLQTSEGHRAPLDALKLMEKDGFLHLRVFVSWDWKTTLNLAYPIEDIENQIATRAKYQTDLVYPNYVKIFADGTPPARTALLIEPYEGEAEFRGDTLLSADEFRDAFIKFDKMGVGLHVHAVADGTIRRVIDALEAMKEANGDSGVKHKIAHNMMITKEDIARVAKMKDVNLDFSPHIPYPHPGIVSGYIPSVGKARHDRMFPVRTAIEAGIHVGHGSDWLTAQPTPNPFPAIEGFVTRKNPVQPELGTLNPDEAITLEQALVVVTLGSARVLGADKTIGSIERGKFADLIVLDQNLFEIKPTDIGDTKVMNTIVGGEVVYSRAVLGNEDFKTNKEPFSH